ncbi:LamG domain-containing protein [bacterium]|nr:LamG domain-containing protein [bacterium]
MKPETALAKLLEGWLDGGLSDAEQSDLLRRLDEDPELRRRLAEQVATLGATRAAADANPRWLALFDALDLADDPGGEVLSFESITMSRIESASRRPWHSRAAGWGVAAAVALLLAGGFLWKIRQPNPADSTLVAAPSRPADPSFVAVVIGGSPEAGFATGSYLKPGLISQTEGWMTLQTLNGVSVTLDAPFEASILSHDRVLLNKGRARVRVPEGAEGFRLESPAFDVVDLGTEFAALVHADGTGTCRVFVGRADVSLLDSIGEVKRTQQLVASESVRITPSSQDLSTIQESDDAYPEIKQPPRPKLHIASTYAADVMAMAPVGFWRFEAIRDGKVVNEVSDGIPLQAIGTATVAAEDGGNHSGNLTNRSQTEFFQIPSKTKTMLEGDFSISLFAQFAWLQNFALISASRYDPGSQGHSFVLQSYASFRRFGFNGTGLHAALRNPPAWDGGVEVYGNMQVRPLHWHHIAATRSQGEMTLYLDGEVVAREFVGKMPLDSRQIFVGRLNGNATQSRMEARGLVGHIDELAIFSRALSDGEIHRIGNP